MKKILTTLSAAAMLAATMITPISASASGPSEDYLSGRLYHRVVWTDNGGPTAHRDVIAGDANNDGVLSLSDAVAILQYAANPQKYGNIDLDAADVDGNGYIEQNDATLIQYFDSGLVNHFKGYQYYFNILGTLNTNGTYRVFHNSDKKFSAVLIGDVNNDKKINISDVVLTNRAKNEGFFIFGDDYIRAGRAADINNDGRVNDTDTDLMFDVIVSRRPNFDDIA